MTYKAYVDRLSSYKIYLTNDLYKTIFTAFK